MNVLYTCDNNYIWLMGISAISLFENNKHIMNLTVYLLGERISDENKEILGKIGSIYKRKIVVIDIPMLDIPERLVSARWPLSAFTRLFSGQLLPTDIHKVLYLDCDTIIRGDILPLNKVDLTLYVCGGIKDCIGKTYKENIGLGRNDIYINAGVVLFNLDELRKTDIKMAIDTYMSRYLKLINYADQDIINGIFVRKIKILEPQYNVMTIATVHGYDGIVSLRRPTNYYNKAEIGAAVSEPVIIHYTTNMNVIRPWFENTDHPLKDEFRKYMDMSPWKDKQLKHLFFNSKTNMAISIIERMPKNIATSVLGLIHSELKPLYIRVKATKSLIIKRI